MAKQQPVRSLQDILHKVQRAQSHGGDATDWKDGLQRLSSAAAYPLLYERALTVGGAHDLPVYVCENQHDHTRLERGHMNLATMKRVERESQFLVERNDGAAGGTDAQARPQRLFLQRQKKFGIHNNKDHGEYDRRKSVIVATTRNLFAACGAPARPLLDFLDASKAAGYKIDDLCDAFLLALETGIEVLCDATRALYGVRAVERHGTGACDLGGGTIRVNAVDPGTRNYARCLVEVSGLDAARLETYVTATGEAKEHEVARPRFRVLAWQLLDLVQGGVRAEYRGGPSAVLAIQEPLGVSITASANAAAKRKRVPTPEDTPRPLKRAKAARAPRLEKPRAALIDLVDEAEDH